MKVFSLKMKVRELVVERRGATWRRAWPAMIVLLDVFIFLCSWYDWL
jgi:hypothetical protein